MQCVVYAGRWQIFRNRGVESLLKNHESRNNVHLTKNVISSNFPYSTTFSIILFLKVYKSTYMLRKGIILNYIKSICAQVKVLILVQLHPCTSRSCVFCSICKMTIHWSYNWGHNPCPHIISSFKYLMLMCVLNHDWCLSFMD